MSLRKLFDANVPMLVPTPASCWWWLGKIRKNGYGALYWNGVTHYAHRISYQLHKGPIPTGLEIDHLCRNPRCVNPDHLEAVTSRINTLRGKGLTAQNASKTHCKNGHPLGDGKVSRGRNERRCKICNRVRTAKHSAKDKEKFLARKRELYKARKLTARQEMK